MKFRIGVLCLLVMIFSISGTFTAAGADAPDLARKCSLTVFLASDTDQNNTAEGAEITIYQIAEASLESGVPEYSFAPAFAGCGEDIASIADRAADLEKYAADNGIKGSVKLTGNDGMADFEQLSAGAYLVTETATVGTFTSFDPFVMYLPGLEDDEWKYNAFAAPKITADAISTDDVAAGSKISVSVKKVWNDEGASRPTSVKVNLVSDSGVYDTVTLSADNDWTYTWKGVSSKVEWRVEEIDVPAGYTPSYSKDGHTFIITNSTKLIQTGQLNWPVPVLFFAGLLFVTAGIMVNICRRRVNDEK